MRKCIQGIGLVLIVLSCQTSSKDQFTFSTKQGEFSVRLIRSEKANYLESYKRDSLISRWPLPYPIYRIEQGDVNNDGQDDLAVGVIKSTRRDSVVRKRIFLFQLQQGHVIPLWLGSSVGKPLEDFRIQKLDDQTLIQTIEIEENHRFLVAEYEWFGFGLSFREYLCREVSLDEARHVLNR